MMYREPSLNTMINFFLEKKNASHETKRLYILSAERKTKYFYSEFCSQKKRFIKNYGAKLI